MKSIVFFPCLFVILFSAGCIPQSEPIKFGKDHCEYCKMGIVDPKFGSELVTDKGRVYKFDAIECMVPFLQENPDIEPAHLLGIAYDDPAELYNVDDLYFEVDEKYQSPMGANIAALTRTSGNTVLPANSFTWQQLQHEISAK